MKCCSKNKKKQLKGPLKFIGMMGICCLAPILLATLIPLLGLRNSSANIFIPMLSSLICPLMMGGMVFTLFKSSKGNKCCKNDSLTNTQDSIDL